MRPSAASLQLAETDHGPPDLLEGPCRPAGRPATAGTAAAALVGTCLAAKRPALLPCGLTAEELASLTAQVEARSGSSSPVATSSSEGGSGKGSGSSTADRGQPPWPEVPAAPSAAAGLSADTFQGPGPAATAGAFSDPWPAEQPGSEGRGRHSFDQVNQVAAARAEEPWAAVAGRDRQGRRSFDQVNRVAAAVAAEKARRRSLQRQLQAAAAIRPRSHVALRTLAQHAAPASPDLARAALPLLGRQRSASEGQIEALLDSGRQVLAPAPATHRPANEALTAAQRLAALGPGTPNILPSSAARPAGDLDARTAGPSTAPGAQPAAMPVLRSSAPPEAPALRQLRTPAAGGVSINGRGSSPRVHLRDPQLTAAGSAASPGAAAAAGLLGEQEAPPPFPTDPGLLAWFSASSDSAALQPGNSLGSGLGPSPGNRTGTVGGGHGGRLSRPGAAQGLPTRLHIHAASPPIPLDKGQGKSAVPQGGRPTPIAPGSPGYRHVMLEGGTEGPDTPRRRSGLLSAAARFFRP